MAACCPSCVRTTVMNSANAGSSTSPVSRLQPQKFSLNTVVRCTTFTSGAHKRVREPLVAVASLSQTIAPPVSETVENSRFSEVLDSICTLHTEVGEDGKAVVDYIQKADEETDYGRRAYLYGRSAEMATSTKMKEDKVVEDMELLQSDVLESDTGISPTDYLRRAELFKKSAEIFVDCGGNSSS